jgi:hypothetical protein
MTWYKCIRFKAPTAEYPVTGSCHNDISESENNYQGKDSEVKFVY